jgi:hypothetical protein
MELTIENYLSYTVQDARQAVPSGEVKSARVRIVAWVKHNFVSKRETAVTAVNIKTRPLFERILLRFIEGYKKRFATLNLELAKISEQFANNPDIILTNPKEEYEQCKTIIDLLTIADILFDKINYFDDEVFKFQVKNSLEVTYQIEAEIKIRAFKGVPIKKTSPELLKALSGKSMESLAHSLKLSRN